MAKTIAIGNNKFLVFINTPPLKSSVTSLSGPVLVKTLCLNVEFGIPTPILTDMPGESHEQPYKDE